MKLTLFSLVGWLLGNALLLRAAFAAEAVAGPAESTSEPEGAVVPLPAVFNTELPRLLLPESLRLTLRPHFGDLTHHDYMRLTFGARYGLTPQWELGADVDTYFAHGLGDVKLGSEAGVSTVELGVKYRFDDFLSPYWETAAGLKYSFPVGHPPADLTDGLHHLTPYMTLAHEWKSRPEVTTFVSYGVHFVTHTDVITSIDKGMLNANSWFITPGVVWRRGAFDYSVETVFSSTLGLSSSETYQVTVRPSVKWTLPPELTFHARSRWVVGVSVHGGYGSEGEDFGANLQLQTNFNFRRFLKNSFHPDAAWLK